MTKTDTIPSFTFSQVITQGLDSITAAHDNFEIVYYGHDPSLTETLNNNNKKYKVVHSRGLPPDFYGNIIEYKKKTDVELRYEDINMQIRDLEKRFNIKITYTKL